MDLTYCTTCGKPLEPAWAYCPYCSTKRAVPTAGIEQPDPDPPPIRLDPNLTTHSSTPASQLRASPARPAPIPELRTSGRSDYPTNQAYLEHRIQQLERANVVMGESPGQIMISLRVGIGLFVLLTILGLMSKDGQVFLIALAVTFVLFVTSIWVSNYLNE